MKTFLYLLILSIPIFIYFFRDSNFYKLIMIFGKKGSGKTSLIAKLSNKFIKKGYKCYTNVPVSGCYLYDPKDIGVNTFEPNSVVFCDEVGIIWNNRDFKNFQKCVIEWFKLQRHYHIRMYLFSQTFDCDKVLRNLTDQMYILRRCGKVSIMRPIYKQIGISTDKDGNGQLVDTFKYGSFFSCEFTFLPRWYGLFDSFTAPELPLIESSLHDYNELSRVYSDGKRWICYIFRKYFEKFKAYALLTYQKIKK